MGVVNFAAAEASRARREAELLAAARATGGRRFTARDLARAVGRPVPPVAADVARMEAEGRWPFRRGWSAWNSEYLPTYRDERPWWERVATVMGPGEILPPAGEGGAPCA